MLRAIKIAAFLIASAFAGGLAATLGSSDATRLTFLSVGQGDCAVFQTAGQAVLIDVGPKMGTNDAGKRIVVPDLRRLGIDSVDLILLSHPDMDHVGGLGAVLKSIPVGKIGISACFKSDEELLRHLADAGCPMDKIVWLGPDQWASVGDFSLEVGCPSWFPGDPDNDGSEFVRITGRGSSAVFTGDADVSTEHRMLSGHDWHAQVLKLGHHGSHTANGEEWLESVAPKWAIVSCGKNNRYGHPHQDVLDRVGKLGIRVARTDRDGEISFELGSSGWQRSN